MRVLTVLHWILFMQVNSNKKKNRQRKNSKQLKTRMIEANFAVYFFDSVGRKRSTMVLVFAEI